MSVCQPILTRYQLTAHLGRVVAALWLPLAVAQVPGIESVMTVGESLAAAPVLRLSALPSRVQLSPAGHVVGVATLAGDGVTAANDQALVYVAPNGQPQVLLRKSDLVSDFNGEAMVVTGVNEAFVDRFGRVATFVNLTHPTSGRSQGILRWAASHLELIAYEGQDLGGERLGEVNSLWLTSQGQLRFLGLARNNHPTTAFYSDRPGPDSVVLGARLPYAGLPEGTWFNGFAGPAAYNHAGQIFCQADVWAPSGAVGGSSRVGGGLWLYDGARVVQVLPSGSVAPDLADQPVISATYYLRVAEDGWVVFEALLKGPGVTTANERALYAAFGDSVRLVARNGSLAPGTPGSDFGYPFRDEGIISRGRALFENTLFLSSGERAASLWVWDNGELRELAEAGQPVTEADGEPVKRFKWKGIAPTGRIVFATDFGARVGAPTGSALWVVDGQAAPQRLLSDGDAMPLPDGGVGSMRWVANFEMEGNYRFDDRGRFLVGLTPEGAGGDTLVWVDPDAILPRPVGTISGTVYQDTDGDRAFSAGDAGLGGVRIELFYADDAGQPSGERLTWVETDGSGHYAFPDNEPGRYVVVETNLPGWTSVADTDRGNDDRVRVELTTAQPSAAGNDFLDAFSLPTGTLTLHRLEPDAVMNLDDQAFSGLLPVRDPERLARLPEVTRGWVADDVTPLILCVRFAAEDLGELREIHWRLLPVRDGVVERLGLDVLRRPCDVYREGEGWVSRIGPDCLLAVAVLPCVAESQLRFGQTSGEIEFTVLVEDVLSGLPLAQRTVALRRPPVMLVHDYNSTGDWSPEFGEAVAVAGRPFAPASRTDNFVRTVRYGQESMVELDSLATPYLTLATKALLQRKHTFAPLADLVPELDTALSVELAALREAWAVTRFDIVGHGQGGVLARMLASEQGVQDSHPAFRSGENFHRGRFRSVITLGAPHNGSRLIAYLRELDRNKDFMKTLPESIVSLGLFSPAVQEKFDPFGDQIKALNNPSGQSPWKPDPTARFHRIAGLVKRSALFNKLGLPSKSNRYYSVNDGESDGLVDETSALANYRHSPKDGRYPFSLGYFGHFESLTVITAGCEPYDGDDYDCEIELPTGLVAGRLVQQLLGAFAQDPDKHLGPLPIPALLGDSARQRIAAAASDAFTADWASSDARVVPDLAGSFAVRSGPGLAGSGTDPGTVYRYRLEAADREPDGEVNWFAEAFGPEGVTADTLTVIPVPDDPGRVEVVVPDSVVGDVVLHANYVLADGRTSFGQPARVVERDPPATHISGIAVLPPSGQYPVGELIKPRLLVAYSDGTVMQRQVTGQDLNTVSSDPNVIWVADPMVWELAQPGRATVTVSYRGFSTSSRLTVQPAPPSDPRIWIVSWSFEGGTFRLAVAASADAALSLWRSPSLGTTAWSEVVDALVTPVGDGTVTLRDPHPAAAPAFYRVRAVSP